MATEPAAGDHPAEPYPVVIVGGSDAGIAAALRIRELAPDVRPVVLLADAHPNFSICGLPYYLSGETPRWQDLAHRTAADLEAAGLDLRPDHRVTAVDPDRRLVTVTTPDGANRVLGYRQLVLATGAEPRRPPIDGLDLDGVHLLHTMAHAFAVHDRLAAGARTAVVVGAGYIGLELADAFRHRGMAVTVVEMLDQVLPTVDAPLATALQAVLEPNGVTVRTGVTVKAVEGAAGGLRVLTDDGGAHPADLVVVAAGVQPAAALARAAGIGTGVAGAIAVDRAMRTDRDGVLAAGDCVTTWHALLQRPAYLPLGTTAHKQGRVAGATAVGVSATFAGSVGSQAVKVFDRVVCRTGLRHDEAAAEGWRPRTVEVTVDDHKAYYPGATPLRIRLTGEEGDGRLLGAQLLGHLGAEVAKRCDVVAVAVQRGMGVADLLDLDLTYTPPLSAPWDPLQQAAQAWLHG